MRQGGTEGQLASGPNLSQIPGHDAGIADSPLPPGQRRDRVRADNRMASRIATANHVPGSRVVIVAPGDRTAAFARARRHTRFVKAMRWTLPVACLLAMSSYWTTAIRSFKVGSGKVTVPEVTLSTEDLTMERPLYEGYGKDGSRYWFKAATAVQDLRQQGPIRLNEIDGKLQQADNGVILLKSPRGAFDNKANILELMDRVDIDGDNGLKARMTQATLLLKEHKVVSTQPVLVEMPTGQVRGNEMVLLQDKRQVTFSNGVKTRLKPQGNADPARAAPTPGLAQTRTLGAGNAPVDVSAAKLFIDDNRKVALFTGDVTAQQGEATLNARELEAHYEGQPVALGADKSAAPKADTMPNAPAEGGKLKRLYARTDVVMVQAGDRATSANGDFDPVKETAVLTGSVVMTSAPDRKAVADRADLDQRADTALLTGPVEVTQGRNILRGRRLFVDRKTGTLQLTAPAETGQPAGRIFTRFYQADADGAASKKGPAKPQTPPASPLAGFGAKSDPNTPIDIEAATLDANDTLKTAIYRGDVKAVQGESAILTPELIAHYTGSAAAGMGPTGARGDPAPKGTTQLTRVQARQKVTVTSANDQSATGDQADFDIKTNTVIVTGNVTMKQGRNVSHGPKAVIDLTTGLYRMESPTPTSWNSTTSPVGYGGLPDLNAGLPAQPSPKVADPATGCPPGRMCAVFHQQDAKDAERKQKPKPPSEPPTRPPAERAKAERTGPTSSSWEATTVPPRNPN